MKSLFEHNGDTLLQARRLFHLQILHFLRVKKTIWYLWATAFEFLQEHHRLTYINLLISGKIDEYLSEIENKHRNVFVGW